MTTCQIAGPVPLSALPGRQGPSSARHNETLPRFARNRTRDLRDNRGVTESPTRNMVGENRAGLER